ncbi:MAG: hypothetical protein LBP62_02150 [Clostridiales bacterium]|nr:hypothetical protein [Clostridiales bacterium]
MSGIIRENLSGQFNNVEIDKSAPPPIPLPRRGIADKEQTAEFKSN